MAAGVRGRHQKQHRRHLADAHRSQPLGLRKEKKKEKERKGRKKETPAVE
jgi:hypothetical protein